MSTDELVEPHFQAKANLKKISIISYEEQEIVQGFIIQILYINEEKNDRHVKIISTGL